MSWRVRDSLELVRCQAVNGIQRTRRLCAACPAGSYPRRQCVQGGAAVKADVKEDTKAKSFLVSSEVPIIGTALVGATMIGAFLLYMRSKGSTRQQTISTLA